MSDHQDQLDRIESLLRFMADTQQRKDWYSCEEFSRLVSLAPFTIRKYCRDGRLAAQKRGIRRGQADEWVLSHAEYLRFERDGLLPTQTHAE